MKITSRGFVPEDRKFFSQDTAPLLKAAAKDLKYLADNGYPMKNASVFVGNHYSLSERQRLALIRSVSPEKQLAVRSKNEIKIPDEKSVFHIDGFNTVITLEVAFSGSPVFRCMDGTFRDLAGLRGTYRLIDKTERAIDCIGKTLEKHKAEKAVFYLDAPVSNSGRLGQKIKERFEKYSFKTEIVVINEVDYVLKHLSCVVSSDAIILDNCISWYNLTGEILEQENLIKNAYQIW